MNTKLNELTLPSTRAVRRSFSSVRLAVSDLHAQSVLVLFLTVSSICPVSRLARAQALGGQIPIAKTTEVLLSAGGWKQGSFPMGEGEQHKAYLPTFNDDDFHTVQVPGEVQLQLGLQGMELYQQSKELTLVNNREWWYRKHFVAPSNAAGKRISLKFEGVDYFASVWLNGKKLGEHEGSYVGFSFDVTTVLNYSAENLLVVKVTCPWIPPEARGFLEYLKGDYTLDNLIGTVRLPSPPYQLGPHWDGIPAGGNAVFPMGIWRDVKLVVSGTIVVEDLFVHTRSLNPDGSATLEISGTIHNFSPRVGPTRLQLQIKPDSFAGEPLALPEQSLTLRPGQNSFKATADVKDARLWWTWDLGEPNLYRLVATISSPAGDAVDSRETVFGIRTISRRPDMSYWLNGKRLFLKGAWYPMADYYGSKPTRETYARSLRMYRAANLNHLVNTTVVEKPDFYDLCDQLGLLVFLELPFGNWGPMEVLDKSYSRHDIFIKESLRQFRQIIIEHRNHPSIIEWSPFAEAHQGGSWSVGGIPLEKYGYSSYAETIQKLVLELDPGAIYQGSLCDMGEQHLWMAGGGFGTTGGYYEHFDANVGFVSEYGSISMPPLQSLQAMLSPQDLWSDRNKLSARWYDLPINNSTYAYWTSLEYDGLSNTLYRINEFVDRHITSPQELVDDSQLYQAFLLKYATEAYRRKKYHSINGTRVWAYGEVTPGIRFGVVDYAQTPKMGYYYLKNAQARFALNFAYRDALESQVSGKQLHIPVWVINDYQRRVPLDLHLEISDLKGQTVWSKDLTAEIEADVSQQVFVVDWVTPDVPGVYMLRGRAAAQGDTPEPLVAETSAFIKVTPRLFSRPISLLLIGERQYSHPIAEMVRAFGVQVDLIDENSLGQLTRLENASELHARYSVVWVASFGSLWKLLDAPKVAGLKEAIQQGLGFIHTGGPGSYHGGYGLGAGMDLSSLAEALPVSVQTGNDLVFGDIIPGQKSTLLWETTADIFKRFTPVKEIRMATEAAGAGWTNPGFEDYGLPGFNEVKLNPESRQILTIQGRPLLVTGRFGQGRTVAFTGFTPSFTPEVDWMYDKSRYEYFVDQEFVTNPVTKAYFSVFMQMVAAAVGEKSAANYREVLAARDKPLFETLQDLPQATLKMPGSLKARIKNGEATATLVLTNDAHYARLVRLRDEWKGGQATTPYLVLYSDNYFDLAPGEIKTVELHFFLPEGAQGEVTGELVIEGANVKSTQIGVVVEKWN